MTRDDIVLNLYKASDLIERSCRAMEADGNTAGARACREAACGVLQAISAAVKQRAEVAS